MNYLLSIVIVVAFASVVFYGIDEYTGFAVKYNSCSDSDGVDYNVKGVVSLTKERDKSIGVKEDGCRSFNQLREWRCEGNQPKYEIIICDKRCVDGACRDCKRGECSYGDLCLSKGVREIKLYRDVGEYCNGDVMVKQKVRNFVCDFDYECVSNDCYKGICK